MKSIFTALAELHNTGGSGALCTIVESQGSTPRSAGSKLLAYPDGATIGTVGGGEVEQRVIEKALEAIRDGQTTLQGYNLNDPEKGDPGMCGGSLTVFIEPVLPRDKLIVVGGGHVGREVVTLANWLDFHVTVCDDRPEFCNPNSVPKADDYRIGALPEITSRSFIVLTTRNVEIDLDYLPSLLNSDAAYIGVIGSHRRWKTTKMELMKLGYSEEKIDIIHSPIGLAFNAETPREIALSIMAEVVLVQKHGEFKPMSGKDIL